jgi:hypothetical protein
MANWARLTSHSKLALNIFFTGVHVKHLDRRGRRHCASTVNEHRLRDFGDTLLPFVIVQRPIATNVESKGLKVCNPRAIIPSLEIKYMRLISMKDYFMYAVRFQIEKEVHSNIKIVEKYP